MSPSLDGLLRSGLRAVEVGARDLRVARWAVERGHRRFLCLATPEAMASADGAVDARLVPHVYPYSGPAQLGENNGDILILSGDLSPALWTSRKFRQARYVAWLPSLEPAALMGTLGATASVLRGRMAFLGFDQLTLGDGRTRQCVLLELKRHHRPRRYISPVLGVDGFFQGLNQSGVDYVIMRWFENLPAVQPGCDIDMLVADEDIGTVEAQLSDMPGVIPCGLYSVSGLPGTDHLDMAFFPPGLAARTLAHAEWWQDRYRVPSLLDRFLGLAFHVAYHKGPRSGVPSERGGHGTARPAGRHDYAATLRELAAANGIEVTMTLEGLDRCLAQMGWRPPNDMLGRLARNNRWLEDWVVSRNAHWENECPGLTVFLIRRIACELGLDDEVVDHLRRSGFDVVHREELDARARDRVREGARGGNWGRGPWRRSGGEPAVVVVAVDPNPVRPSAKVAAKYPALTNERLLVKNEIRDELNRRLAPEQRCNMLHSSDNSAQAIEYLEMSLPGDVDRLVALARLCTGLSPDAQEAVDGRR